MLFERFFLLCLPNVFFYYFSRGMPIRTSGRKIARYGSAAVPVPVDNKTAGGPPTLLLWVTLLSAFKNIAQDIRHGRSRTDITDYIPFIFLRADFNNTARFLYASYRQYRYVAGMYKRVYLFRVLRCRYFYNPAERGFMTIISVFVRYPENVVPPPGIRS